MYRESSKRDLFRDRRRSFRSDFIAIKENESPKLYSFTEMSTVDQMSEQKTKFQDIK
jgi:hypothetical protein